MTASDDEEEEKEQKEEEELRRKKEYINFKRYFDSLKREHAGKHSDSEKLRQQGNQFFSLGLYMQASVVYSDAIELNPTSAVLYCNRSMAYLKQDMFDEALADAEESLAIDSSVDNIKAYWRKSQALLDLGRLEEAEAAADVGLGLQPANKHLNGLRRKAREVSCLGRLSGCEWSCKLPNGIEKKMSFSTDGIMTIFLLGHPVTATFELSVEGNPRSMYVKMRPEGPVAGTGPPPPPMPYIFEFRENDQELWLCHPVDSNALPTKFEGPGFDRLKKVPKSADTEQAEEDTSPLDDRVERYMAKMVQAMPLLPPQLPEKPSDQEINEEIVIMDKLSKLKRTFGKEVHHRAVELAKHPDLVADRDRLMKLAVDLQRRFVARRIIAEPTVDLAATAAASGAEAPAAAAAVSAAAAAIAAPAEAKKAKQEPTKGPGCMAGLVASLCGKAV